MRDGRVAAPTFGEITKAVNSVRRIGPTRLVVPDGYFSRPFVDLAVSEPVASVHSQVVDPRREFLAN